MATSNHGSQRELIERFQQQQNQEYARRFPSGRLGADDDGELTYAIAADPKRQKILIQFAHPTDWIGLGPEEAEALRDILTQKLFELRGITT